MHVRGYGSLDECAGVLLVVMQCCVNRSRHQESFSPNSSYFEIFCRYFVSHQLLLTAPFFLLYKSGFCDSFITWSQLSILLLYLNAQCCTLTLTSPLFSLASTNVLRGAWALRYLRVLSCSLESTYRRVVYTIPLRLEVIGDNTACNTPTHECCYCQFKRTDYN